MTLFVKVCGATSPIEPSAFAGVDFLGLNFVASSPRCISPLAAAAIAAATPPHVRLVAVFADPTPDEVARVVDLVPIAWIQLHGDETPKECRRHKVSFVKAFRSTPDAATLIHLIPDYLDGADHPYLLDAAVPGVLGGTGVAVDLSLARNVRDAVNGCMMLAGGLNAGNVAAAVQAVAPWAVDAASGVERSPGVKDPEKMLAFARAARSGCD